MAKIGILFTGGTISMRVDPATNAAVPALGSREILAQVPELAAVADIEAEDISRLPGPHVTPDQMWALAQRAAAWLERSDVDGLVITHGTDTLEETAYLLDLVLTSDKPVAMLGAMRTMSDASWDGPANLIAAARVAASPSSRGRGTVIVMNEQVLSAPEAIKMHTEAAGSFTAPEFGPIGIVDSSRVVFRRERPARPSWRAAGAGPGLRTTGIETRVDLIQAATGMDDTFVRASVANGARGLVIVAFGRGNVPPSIMPALRDAAASGVTVAAASRCVTGRVSARYGYEGGGLDLERAGVLLAGDLTGAKARLLLMTVLGCGTGDARELFLASLP
ncbi:MAG: asparaginase [Acidobacteriota bacterium]|nr:asparaginase [Acidobacteriota bacterium]